MTTTTRTFTLGKKYTIVLPDGSTREMVINSPMHITIDGQQGELKEEPEEKQPAFQNPVIRS